MAPSDCYGEPAVLVLRTGGRPHPPARVGARRLPRTHAQSRGLLSREARRVRGGHATAPPRPRGVEHPRGRNVFLVRKKEKPSTRPADGERPSGSSSSLVRTETRRASFGLRLLGAASSRCQALYFSQMGSARLMCAHRLVFWKKNR